jgi:hypothetical protein
MQRTTYNDTVIYRGQASTGQIVCVDEPVMLANQGDFSAEELNNPDEWLESAGDGESVWIAALCEACGAEFRPIDGYHEKDTYSYCSTCCSW